MGDLNVIVTRGSLVESVHHVSAVIVNDRGDLMGHAGDHSLVTYWRSAAKPFQLMPLLLDGGVERFAIDRQMIALACGSHNAESVHREVGSRWLNAIGATEADLACGGHPSLWPALADAMVHDEVAATPLWSNCSGKHASLLALARLHGWGTSGYEERSHPVQQRVAETIAAWAGLPLDTLRWGVDGCTAAAVALPLRAMAAAYSRLGTATDPVPRMIREAMIGEPYLVAGAERLDTVLMEAWPGEVIAKIGAEGVYSAAFPRAGLGLSLKVHDGDMKAATVALIGVIDQVVHRMQLTTEWPDQVLEPWRRPQIRNTRGVVTGQFELQGTLRWS
ncbi:MAG TPA: asparaginase [Gemmatimonadales bacterium]|jgi:L-asparaginase II